MLDEGAHADGARFVAYGEPGNRTFELHWGSLRRPTGRRYTGYTRIVPLPTGDAVLELYHGLLRRTHLSAPSELTAIVADQAAVLGASDAEIYVIDYGQTVLVPLRPDGPAVLLDVPDSMGGRSYAEATILSERDDAGLRLWLPLLDGTERVGALSLTFPDERLPEDLVVVCERYSHLVALLVVTKGAYSDIFEVARRRASATIASELSRALSPPLVFATDGVVVAGLLEPCYDNGGDALDYALNGDLLHLGLFDAMGHGLAAAGVAAFAIAAYRHSRRSGAGLHETYVTMHDAVGRQFPGTSFVTALIAELEVDSGDLTWLSAGHPGPLLIRDATAAQTLRARPAPPLGVESDGVQPEIGHLRLEPGDQLLFYSDGVTDLRVAGGELLGLDGLCGFVEREAAAGQTAPETLRRLRQSMLVGDEIELHDDVTAMLVQWRRGMEAELMPQTVL